MISRPKQISTAPKGPSDNTAEITWGNSVSFINYFSFISFNYFSSISFINYFNYISFINFIGFSGWLLRLPSWLEHIERIRGGGYQYTERCKKRTDYAWH